MLSSRIGDPQAKMLSAPASTHQVVMSLAAQRLAASSSSVVVMELDPIAFLLFFSRSFVQIVWACVWFPLFLGPFM
jgi:hypothetical protein